MNATRLVLSGILAVGLIAGALLYYLQVYAYYRPVAAPLQDDITLVSLTTGLPEPIPFDDFTGIDADSSPIRYRACFTTPMSQATLTEVYQTYPGATPWSRPAGFPALTPACWMPRWKPARPSPSWASRTSPGASTG